MSRLDLVIQGMPPSVNGAYKTYLDKRGRPHRSLTDAATSFKQSAHLQLFLQLRTHTKESLLVFRHVPLLLKLHFYFAYEDVYTLGDRIKSRYKRMDLSNRVKLLEDALFDKLGIDDSHVFRIELTKDVAMIDRPPFVEITIQQLEVQHDHAKPNRAPAALPKSRSIGAPGKPPSRARRGVPQPGKRPAKPLRRS